MKTGTKRAEVELDDADHYRHFCPASERFGSGDALLHALENGWTIHGVVFRQDYWHAGVRRVPVYHVTLRRYDDLCTMSIVQNPFISRLLIRLNVQTVLMNQRKHTSRERW